ncbi:metalloregulator ArsR/SmtB family transcription factor [Pontixanthobacter aestiaquae]|uniref:Metalloregulator ArsR/SmtB family transcription factor n=1 Tax=Pontixanthobacter aestiaquae TaxID=1509367 RepID=A0A844Z4D4_9SPHN|nr:metalloregulator ArsR/SmtB family transcription factor [Pontixanthobacter aestiaquae]MDN3646433.1 metalloregulator ArsR/SmtB family transcription factor [Pontixanthobacter aestiaquae]MXO82578.1 metalloregulator ArsR/SmtB family transcription factor [Pontixanthobacter aestiaquae]
MRIETTMRALADPTRLRIMRLLSAMELAVGELAQVLGQSQPRVSRHVAILCDAGLAERHREGSWVFLRASVGNERGDPVGEAVSRLLATAEREDEAFAAMCADDRRQLQNIRGAREENAASYFARHADQWDELRQLHSPDQLVEERLLTALGEEPLGQVLDIGTGSGRMAELFAPKADHIVALDKSLDMLRVARAKLQNLPSDGIELVQGDFIALPFQAHRFDTVLLHQVLHFAQDPAAALAEAARVTRPAGRIAIVDFAAHDHEELRDRHAHVRLGFTDKAIHDLLREAGYQPARPIALDEGELTVKIWLGTRLGMPASSDARKAVR